MVRPLYAAAAVSGSICFISTGLGWAATGWAPIHSADLPDWATTPMNISNVVTVCLCILDVALRPYGRR
ncbi:hypothetical protein [Streptomyces longwoodensis]|uniref:hypothetical protein n=1 Tax=Streptomyces longwoodensis TaxID=68231 RepID=UPI0033C005CE